MFAGKDEILPKCDRYFQLYMLDLNKQPHMWQNYPKWSQQKEFAQSNTMPVKISFVFKIAMFRVVSPIDINVPTRGLLIKEVFCFHGWHI